MLYLFWIFLSLIFYTYVGYGVMMWVLSRTVVRPVHRECFSPTVCIIVAAYNEAKHITDKLDNILALDYPASKLSVIVGSDASDDETDEIVRNYESESVRLIRVEGRLGKTAVQNKCVSDSSAEIIVFTDATTLLYPGSLQKLVMSFADESVGCVGGRLIYQDNSKSQVGAGGTRYWSYEALLKQWESAVNSLIGVSGCYYAVRKDVYSPIQTNLISDFVIALDVYCKGYRVVYEDTAICEEETLDKNRDEFAMRARVALRTYCALFARKSLLNPFRYGLFSIQLISHKVFRYAVGLFLIGLYISNIFLLAIPFYKAFFILQTACYIAAALGSISSVGVLGKRVFSIPHYFVLVNIAALVAFFRYLKGERIVVWTPER